MSGREYLQRGDGGDKVGIGGKMNMFLFVFLIFAFAQRRRAAPEYLGWEWGGALLIKAPRLLLLSTPSPSLPLSASTFPILKPRGKAKPAVNLNRYNSCRPKQCTEGSGSERQRAAKVGTDRNNAPGRVWGGGGREGGRML